LLDARKGVIRELPVKSVQIFRWDRGEPRMARSAGKGIPQDPCLVAESLEAEIASEAGHTFAQDNHD
jgi:hypothetical protein